MLIFLIMPFIIDVSKIKYEANAYSGDWGTQCVALVQMGPPAAGSSNPPGTSSWRRGISVKSAPANTIQKGTVIATFTPAGTYPNKAEGSRHAAVYISHDSKGITVIDQWDTKTTPSQRVLSFVGDDQPRAVDKGDQYFIVELTLAPIEGQTGINQQTIGP